MHAASRADQILRDTFGYPAFRGQQRDIVAHIAEGGDALVLMPTGGGKSLCYQIPALVREGMGVVVSPLIALMQDQVAALEEAGVRAAALNSSMSWPDVQDVERRARRGGDGHRLSAHHHSLYRRPEHRRPLVRRLWQPEFASRRADEDTVRQHQDERRHDLYRADRYRRRRPVGGSALLRQRNVEFLHADATEPDRDGIFTDRHADREAACREMTRSVGG